MTKEGNGFSYHINFSSEKQINFKGGEWEQHKIKFYKCPHTQFYFILLRGKRFMALCCRQKNCFLFHIKSMNP